MNRFKEDQDEMEILNTPPRAATTGREPDTSSGHPLPSGNANTPRLITLADLPTHLNNRSIYIAPIPTPRRRRSLSPLNNIFRLNKTPFTSHTPRVEMSLPPLPSMLSFGRRASNPSLPTPTLAEFGARPLKTSTPSSMGLDSMIDSIDRALVARGRDPEDTSTLDLRGTWKGRLRSASEVIRPLNVKRKMAVDEDEVTTSCNSPEPEVQDRDLAIQPSANDNATSPSTAVTQALAKPSSPAAPDPSPLVSPGHSVSSGPFRLKRRFADDDSSENEENEDAKDRDPRRQGVLLAGSHVWGDKVRQRKRRRVEQQR